MAERKQSVKQSSRRQSRKQSARKSSRRQSRKSSRRQSRKSSRRQSKSRGSIARGGKSGSKGGKFNTAQSPWLKGTKDHLKTGTSTYESYFKEILKKREVFIKDCNTGRKNFLNWFGDTLRGLGLNCEQRKMPGTPLQLYGPEGCPNVLFAWNVKQMPKKWTLCLIGNFDIAEPRLKEPSLLLDGRFIPGRYKPENWGILATWLSVLKVISNISSIQWPINFKIVWTANQADDSGSLIKFIREQKNEFFSDVDFFCNCTTLSNTSLPAGIVYGGRGACHFILEISEGRVAESCSSQTGHGRQAANDMMCMLDDLQKDCIYTYFHIFEPFKLPQHFEQFARKAYVRDLNPELGHWFKPSVIKKKELNFVDMWKPEVKIESINGFPKNKPLFTPGTVVSRFWVKYMSDTAPCRVEEMVNRLLKKKWDGMSSNLMCKLSMDYWSRPWLAECDNQLIKRAKRAISKAFHTTAVESFDFTPNPLPAVLELILGKDLIVLSLASMLDLGKPSLRKNFVRNIKAILSFIQILQRSHTQKQYTKIFEKKKDETKEIREFLGEISYERQKTQRFPPEVPIVRNSTLKRLHVI